MESFEARVSARSSGETEEDGLEDFVAVRVVRATAIRVLVVGGMFGVDAERESAGEGRRRVRRAQEKGGSRRVRTQERGARGSESRSEPSAHASHHVTALPIHARRVNTPKQTPSL